VRDPLPSPPHDGALRGKKYCTLPDHRAPLALDDGVRRHQRPHSTSHRRSTTFSSARRKVSWTEDELHLADLIVAETIYVLESVYRVAKPQIAQALRSAIAIDSMVVADSSCLLRALEVHDRYCLDFAEAYLMACAESSGIGGVASFDQSIDRVDFVERIEP
jgi:predicted nucleic acid-binding protein